MQSLRVFLNSSQTWKLNSLQSVPNSVGHMGTTTVMQPNAVVSEFTRVFTLDVCTQCLKHLTVIVDTNLLLSDLKSSSRGPSVSRNTDTYGLIFFRLGEVGCPHCTPAVFLWVQNGETTPHHLPQYAEELHHQYGKDPIFQQQWNVFASKCETRQENTWWYPWLHTTACTVTISSTDKEQMVWCLCPCRVFSTCALFSRSVTVWACLGLGTSINCSLLTYNIWDQTTLIVFNIHVAPHTTHIHLHISAGWHTSAQKIPSLWSCPDTITTWYTVL